MLGFPSWDLLAVAVSRSVRQQQTSARLANQSQYRSTASAPELIALGQCVRSHGCSGCNSTATAECRPAFPSSRHPRLLVHETQFLTTDGTPPAVCHIPLPWARLSVLSSIPCRWGFKCEAAHSPPPLLTPWVPFGSFFRLARPPCPSALKLTYARAGIHISVAVRTNTQTAGWPNGARQSTEICREHLKRR